MYNRYIHDRQGNFTRIAEEPVCEPVCAPPPPSPAEPPPAAPEQDWIRRILSRLGMQQVDTGDLLLLLILFLLFSDSEKRDDELLMALGLLLIL